MLNTARLAERWREAKGDPVRMAAALGEELAEEDNRLVTKADLEATRVDLRSEIQATKADLQTEIQATKAGLQREIGDVRVAMSELEARLYWRLLAGAGVMLAAIGLMIRYLTPVA